MPTSFFLFISLALIVYLVSNYIKSKVGFKVCNLYMPYSVDRITATIFRAVVSLSHSLVKKA